MDGGNWTSGALSIGAGTASGLLQVADGSVTATSVNLGIGPDDGSAEVRVDGPGAAVQTPGFFSGPGNALASTEVTITSGGLVMAGECVLGGEVAFRPILGSRLLIEARAPGSRAPRASSWAATRSPSSPTMTPSA